MITPLIAAYFLRAKGIQPHASGWAMDKYLGLLKWSLDTSKAEQRRARIAQVRGHIAYAAVPIAIGAVVSLFAVMGMINKAPADSPPSMGMEILVFLLVLLIAACIAWTLMLLLGLIVGLFVGSDRWNFTSWSRYVGRHIWATLFDHRIIMVGAGLGALMLTGVLLFTLKMSFQPPLNLDFSQVNISMPPGATLQQSEDVADRAASVVARDPDVEHVFERIYVGSGYLNIVLKRDRQKTSTEFERSLAPALAAIPDARVNFQSQNGGGPGGGRDIMLYLGGEDPVKLQAAANAIADQMAKLPGLRAPRVMGDTPSPEITIKPRFDLAADLGVTTMALSQTIRIATLGDIEQNSAKFSLSDRQVPIQVSLADSDRRDINTLMNLPVPTSNGGSVPLKAVAEIGFGAGPGSIQRTNQERRTQVGADLAPGLTTGDVWPKINQLPAVKNLPSGVHQLNLGNQKWQAEMIFYFMVALLSGVGLVFAVLVLLYRRFLAPFVNMGSLWLCPLGAAIALHIAGQPLSLPVLIGMLMLFGIVAKNSILLVDFAVEMMNHGMPKNDAIYEAGHKRAQPIVMTTVAMVAGMLPIALSLTGDGSWRAPMGVTVIGGLIFSTLLTLLLVPAYFSLAISIESRIGRLFHRFIGGGAHDVGHAVPAE
jgi:multidrug efflux pump subunit AcrB